MKIVSKIVIVRRTLIAAAVASALLAGCAAAPVAPEGASEARAKLTQLQSDPNLASRAPAAIKEAEAAVRTAEQPELDRALGEHRVYTADRKVEIARAQAQTRFTEDQRAGITAERAAAQLNSRTHEVDVAREATDVARVATDAARVATADANEKNAELQRQIAALQAKPTDRGLVLTLGDVLFASGQAELRAGAASNLGQLVSFLEKYPGRTAAIEGHTDSVGGEDYNRGLSQRRADSVRTYLVSRGVDAARVTAIGAGESSPVAENDSSAGREQNRRVEVIISNPAM